MDTIDIEIIAPLDVARDKRQEIIEELKGRYKNKEQMQQQLDIICFDIAMKHECSWSVKNDTIVFDFTHPFPF